MSGDWHPSLLQTGFAALKGLPVELRTHEFALIEHTTLGQLAQVIKAWDSGQY